MRTTEVFDVISVNDLNRLKDLIAEMDSVAINQLYVTQYYSGKQYYPWEKSRKYCLQEAKRRKKIPVESERENLQFTEKGLDLYEYISYLNRQISPLMFAALTGNLKAVEIIMSKEGVNVNQHNAMADTALMFAIREQQIDIVKSLLSDDRIETDIPLILAQESGNQEIITLIKNHQWEHSFLYRAIVSPISKLWDALLITLGIRENDENLTSKVQSPLLRKDSVYSYSECSDNEWKENFFSKFSNKTCRTKDKILQVFLRC